MKWLKQLEHCELISTYRLWWRYKTVISKSFRYLLNLDIASQSLHVIWICPGYGLVPIRQQALNKTHDDKDKSWHLLSPGHNKNKLTTEWETNW